MFVGCVTAAVQMFLIFFLRFPGFHVFACRRHRCQDISRTIHQNDMKFGRYVLYIVLFETD